MKARYADSNLTAIAASAIVLLYAAGVAYRRSPHWYEWAAAALGAGFCIWFWITEFQRARRRRDRGR